jgi:peptidoglycan-associated lipoprotein
MKKQIAFAVLLASTGIAIAQTAPPEDIKTYINDQITDAVTQLNNSITNQKSEIQTQIEVLEKQMIELQSVIDEYDRRHNIDRSLTLFNYNTVDMTADSAYLVSDVVAFMKDYPNYNVLIEGHTDERGTREYNLALGERRAHAMRNLLIASGINANRIETVSYGKERPIIVGANEEAWKQNRRVQFILR